VPTGLEVFACTDGKDNDCDTFIDCADVDCFDNPACCVVTEGQEEVETDCTDKRDNDCDGKTDCKDSDCSGDPACKRPPPGGGGSGGGGSATYVQNTCCAPCLHDDTLMCKGVTDLKGNCRVNARALCEVEEATEANQETSGFFGKYIKGTPTDLSEEPTAELPSFGERPPLLAGPSRCTSSRDCPSRTFCINGRCQIPATRAFAGAAATQESGATSTGMTKTWMFLLLLLLAVLAYYFKDKIFGTKKHHKKK